PAPSAQPAAPQPAPSAQPAAPAPQPAAPAAQPDPAAPLPGMPDQPLSKNGYAPTMMAYSAPPSDQAAAPLPAAGQPPAEPQQPAPGAAPTGPIPEPFTQASDAGPVMDQAAAELGAAFDQAAAQAGPSLNQAAADAGPALDQAAGELNKGFGALGAAASDAAADFDKPKKKKSPLIYVGVGCAVLFLLALLGGGACTILRMFVF
ncbi:MAG: hypothetical protein JRG91_10400, partial [Deltaproteobacteria bacterium]|nr:hypothetical protein [Deltaproteobacteria bacterium]